MTQTISINIDALKGNDRKFVCGAMIDQIKHNRTRLYPSNRYSKQYGVIYINKDRELANKKIAKNSKVLLFGKTFDKILARATSVTTKDVTYLQANLAG